MHVWPATPKFKLNKNLKVYNNIWIWCYLDGLQILFVRGLVDPRIDYLDFLWLESLLFLDWQEWRLLFAAVEEVACAVDGSITITTQSGYICNFISLVGSSSSVFTLKNRLVNLVYRELLHLLPIERTVKKKDGVLPGFGRLL